MLLGTSMIAASCSKEDRDEVLNVSNNTTTNTNNPTPPPNTAVPAVPGWKTLETMTFRVEVPDNWQAQEMGGTDTYTGILSNATDRLHYEYGVRQKPYYIDPQRFNYHYERVGGKMAKIVERNNGQGQYGIVVDTVKVDAVRAQPEGFVLMAPEGANMDKMITMRILRSVQFK